MLRDFDFGRTTRLASGRVLREWELTAVEREIEALLGIYVGVIPVALGMLWLPWIRRIPKAWLRVVMALTIEPARLPRDRRDARGLRAGRGGLAGLRRLGAGADRRRRVAIGSAYSVGALALGAFLVVGFAIHNTTEGLAIVAPIASDPPSLRRLVGLGLVAGGPAVLGAWIGAAAFNSSIAAFLFGFGAGAIVQVMVQLAPTMRDDDGRTLHPASVGGLLAGMAFMFSTGLLVTV